MTRTKPKENVRPNENMPPAGPHAKPELTDNSKTPGSGVTPKADEEETEAPTG
jgi:hypothetical protein